MPEIISTESGATLRDMIRQALWLDERSCLRACLREARPGAGLEAHIAAVARELVVAARDSGVESGGLGAFMREYDLSSREGVLLMCLAEALLRIPDAATADRLIGDRLAKGQWAEHLGSSSSVLVNASSWGLLLTGRLLAAAAFAGDGPEQLLMKLAARLGEPLVRVAMRQAMQLLAQQFVFGRTLKEALSRAGEGRPDLRYSYDCLGEAAQTAGDVERYFNDYREAIRQVGARCDTRAGPQARPGVSIKLSALHPRYVYAQREQVCREMLPRLQLLVDDAAAAGVGITLDAEEAERLELSLDIFERLFTESNHHDWQGLGLAVQAYQKRALPVLVWLRALADRHGRMIPLRLVKGAYWDSEIKRAQERGLPAYPVFTRKAATDVSYFACMRFLFAHDAPFYPQFASHNALTLAWAAVLGEGRALEFQRLHGMGEALFDGLGACLDCAPPVRIYAPIGSHETLLPYLVRRLLENGANSSFVNQLTDEQTDIETLLANPCDHIEAVACEPHPRIPLPVNLYGESRRNAAGMDLADPPTVEDLYHRIQDELQHPWSVSALLGGQPGAGQAHPVFSPADQDRQLGTVDEIAVDQIDAAMAMAAKAAPEWDERGGPERAACLRRAADLFEAHAPAFIARIVLEGGRTVADALAEVREAVDFCRYYAVCAEREFAAPQRLPGPTGELNELALHGRGVFACISPWNFPLAIFVGQVAAALAAGNAVVAKPARQTPFAAHLAVSLLHAVGVPEAVLAFLPGSGRLVGGTLLSHPALSGVAFTGSTETAWTIQRALAGRRGALLPLIAETGGQNVMIADSSALAEQLVADVVHSAFNSAGQRCSALRVLFVQDDIADRVIDRLHGAMETLRIGDPLLMDTDIGPLIDRDAVAGIDRHIEYLRSEGHERVSLSLPAGLERGCYFAPRVYELESLTPLKEEVFGPVLHLVRYPAHGLDAVIDAVNATGYGLTLGVHSRIESTWERVRARARVGNLYINRNMIGAVVGVQPFGGEGLSGTGPKAGGPHYLHGFATERTCSINTAALGGDTGLLSLSEDTGNDE